MTIVIQKVLADNVKSIAFPTLKLFWAVINFSMKDFGCINDQEK